MTSTGTKGEIGRRNNHGWSPELLTLLGAMLAIGVGLAGLMLNFQGQVRDDIHALETRLREDMRTGESRIREDVRELRGDVGELRERISHIEGRLRPQDMWPKRPDPGSGAMPPS